MSEEVTKKILKEMEQMSKGGEGSGRKKGNTPFHEANYGQETQRDREIRERRLSSR